VKNYKFVRYPDGTTYCQLDKEAEIPEEYVFRINSYTELWMLGQLVDAHWNMWGTAPTITIPNLLDAQADKRFHENESSGLRLVCNFLNGMDAYFKIFHPHNPEVVEALMPGVKIISNDDFVVEVIGEIAKDDRYDLGVNKLEDNLIIMSSDAGGFKPLMKLCDNIGWKGETYSASKARSWDEVDGTKFVQQIDRQDFGGKDILIVDDICVFGGTFKGLSRLLEDRNVGAIYLAVSHMTVGVMPDDSLLRHFNKVYCSNSKFDSYSYQAETSHPIDAVLDYDVHVIKLFEDE